MIHNSDITIQIPETPHSLVGVKAARLHLPSLDHLKVKFKEFLCHGSIRLELYGKYDVRHHLFIEV